MLAQTCPEVLRDPFEVHGLAVDVGAQSQALGAKQGIEDILAMLNIVGQVWFEELRWDNTFARQLENLLGSPSNTVRALGS